MEIHITFIIKLTCTGLYLISFKRDGREKTTRLSLGFGKDMEQTRGCAVFSDPLMFAFALNTKKACAVHALSFLVYR